jgi:Tat protein secretion system quality control protein TatD with DNase activity
VGGTEILNRNRDLIIGGVVHSFDGSLEEALRFVESGFFIGINGWYAFILNKIPNITLNLEILFATIY